MKNVECGPSANNADRRREQRPTHIIADRQTCMIAEHRDEVRRPGAAAAENASKKKPTRTAAHVAARRKTIQHVENTGARAHANDRGERYEPKIVLLENAIEDAKHERRLHPVGRSTPPLASIANVISLTSAYWAYTFRGESRVDDEMPCDKQSLRLVRMISIRLAQFVWRIEPVAGAKGCLQSEIVTQHRRYRIRTFAVGLGTAAILAECGIVIWIVEASASRKRQNQQRRRE